MFLTYLRRELRRRARQAVVIALGLALGVGLVVTVTAASAGVQSAQSQVLHSLYGVGTDITVTQSPAPGSGGFGGFRFGLRHPGSQPAAGSRVSVNRLSTGTYAPVAAADVAAIARLPAVAGASGALLLSDIRLSFTVPGGGGGPGGQGSFRPPVTFSIAGVGLAGDLGPLPSGTITSGRTLARADAKADVAVVDSGYAAQNKISVGSAIAVGSASGRTTRFTVIGIVREPSGSATDVFIPLARAQALAGLAGKVNMIYVAAGSASGIGRVRREISSLLPKATVTTAASLASQVTGSLASAASLASSLGRWLAAAVLAAAFALACLLTVAAVARRVREFGTLKALGWRSRRIVGQVMGEALVLGLTGGAAGAALGYGGAALIRLLAPPLTATLGQASGSAAPGGARFLPGGHSGGPPGGARGPGGPLRGLATAPTVTVHMTAPVTLTVLAAAIALAVAGGLIAGGFGGWRAARLRPAAALAKVG